MLFPLGALNNRNFPFSLPKKNIPESKVRFLNLWGASAVGYKIVLDLAALALYVRRWLSDGLHAAPQRLGGFSGLFLACEYEIRVGTLSPSEGVSRLLSRGCLQHMEEVLQ